MVVNLDVFTGLLGGKEQLDAMYDAHMDEVMRAPNKVKQRFLESNIK